MERQHETDEDQEVHETGTKSQEIPLGWQPSPETIATMQGESEKSDNQPPRDISVLRSPESEQSYSRDKETITEKESGSGIKPSGIGAPQDSSHSDNPPASLPADDVSNLTQNETSEEAQAQLNELKKRMEEEDQTRLAELRRELRNWRTSNGKTTRN